MINFPGVKIGQWITAALSKGRKKETEGIYEDHGYSGVFRERETGNMVPVEKDLMTKKHYPGSAAQGEELRSYGGYRSKTGPGKKAILEWRDLSIISPDLLPEVMNAMFKCYTGMAAPQL